MSLTPLLNESAVIVLLDKSSDSLVLTQRSLNLRDHPGEICFPGGRKEENDIDHWATALRELEEELGIGATRVVLVKKLNIETTLNGSIIYPWLATITNVKPYTPNASEVAGVITIPMSDVKIRKNYKSIFLERYGKRVETCQFTATHHFVWGATARIMKQLCI